MTHKKKTPKPVQTPPKKVQHLTTDRLHDLARRRRAICRIWQR
nr:MAG TPA: hypothetical protein [Caudoviricetes sp.]